MIKPLLFILPVIPASIFLSGCASSPIEKKLENNFIYNCSLQLFEKLDKKITGEGAEKICTAAYNAEEKGNKVVPETAAVVSSPTPASTASASPTPSKAGKIAILDSDEIKPEPMPSASPAKK